MKSISFRQSIRNYELGQVIPFFPTGSSILEIGAGAGWQAKALAEKGFQVEAIDIASSRYRTNRVWPVVDYDGRHIPFPNHHFDIIFSSNTLEHVAHIDEFMEEMQRVLKPNGVAIHIMPSGAWRLWTICTHYPFLPYHVKKGLQMILVPADSKRRKQSAIISKAIKQVIIPSRHGERGNLLSELHLFRRTTWVSLFRRCGWQVKASFPNQLFYTGHGLFGVRLNLRTRHRISYLLGSACNIYVLAPTVVRRSELV